MTANPSRPPLFYRSGKAAAEEDEASEEESDSEEEDEPTIKAPAPKATSFPSRAKIDVDLSKADKQVSTAPKPEPPKDEADEQEGWETPSEEDEESGSGSDEDEESSEEESSSEEELPKPKMLAPKFLSKAQRKAPAQPVKSAEELAAEEESRRKEKADEMLQLQLERDAAAKAAGRKAWDDDDGQMTDEVDDTDDVDPEAERAAWKLRELKRVKRDREAIVEKEREREEVERRRNMSAAEREEEDRKHIEAQKEEREGRGKMGFMQKYFHKGAFFQAEDGEVDEKVREVMERDFAGRKFEDDVGSKEVLPEYMRIRDMTRLGKKGRTRYKDLKTEDTGRWGEFGSKKRDYHGLDERFRPDERREAERTGANAGPVGERRRREGDDDRDREDKRRRFDT